MTTANVTAVQAEVLYSGAPFANVTALGAEVLYNSDAIKINVASFGIQVLYRISTNTRRRPVYIASSS